MKKNKKITILFFLIVILVIILKFLTIHQKLDNEFFRLEKCPSCYGSHCDLFDDLVLEGLSRYRIFNQFVNVKNVFYGSIKDKEGRIKDKGGRIKDNEDHIKRIVLKKLAHDAELTIFDEKVCRISETGKNCKVSTSFMKFIDKYIFERNFSGSDTNLIFKIIQKNPELFDKTEIIKCKDEKTLEFLYTKFLNGEKKDDDSVLYNFLTLLAVNPEPIIFKAFGTILPFPHYFGSCGRVSMVENAGRSLTAFYDAPWIDRARLALQLLKIAEKMTFNEIRMYLTDPSPDNFAVDENLNVRLIDAEDFVLVRPRITQEKSKVHFNSGIGCKDCLSYEYDQLCNHDLADHNFFAICKGLLSARSFTDHFPGGLLHDVPIKISKNFRNFSKILEECAMPIQNENRLKPSENLKIILENILKWNEESISTLN